MKQTKEELIAWYKEKISLTRQILVSLENKKTLIAMKIKCNELNLQSLQQKLREVENNY